MNVSIPKKIPRSTNKNSGAGLKKQYTFPPPKKKFFAPALTRQGARGSGFACAITPVPTNFQGGFTALLITSCPSVLVPCACLILIPGIVVRWFEH
jgi:hypothetical protein